MNEEMINQETGAGAEAEVDYIAAINDLKANTVAKDKYEKLQKENKQLLDTLVNGGQLAQEVIKEPVDINNLRDSLFNERQQTNLSYVDKALRLRSALLDQGERDPFLPIGTHTQITEAEVERAQQIADVLQSCVDYADGNSEIFTNELMRVTNEGAMPRKKLKK